MAPGTGFPSASTAVAMSRMVSCAGTVTLSPGWMTSLAMGLCLGLNGEQRQGEEHRSPAKAKVECEDGPAWPGPYGSRLTSTSTSVSRCRRIESRAGLDPGLEVVPILDRRAPASPRAADGRCPSSPPARRCPWRRCSPRRGPGAGRAGCRRGGWVMLPYSIPFRLMNSLRGVVEHLVRVHVAVVVRRRHRLGMEVVRPGAEASRSTKPSPWKVWCTGGGWWTRPTIGSKSWMLKAQG